MNDKNKILIADDDPEIREVVRILLESEGFTVLEAVDGNQAVELADETCDLVILDIMMPGMSGITACSK
ncbi:MAG: response regulator, partial [Oscillospiraceae bacterium]